MRLILSMLILGVFEVTKIGAQTIQYRYDKAERLIEADYSNHSKTIYILDNDGNRTSQIFSKIFANDAGITAIQSPQNPFCKGLNAIVLKLGNYGSKELDSVKIGWMVNKNTQTIYSWKGKLKSDSIAFVTLGSYSFPTGTDTIISWVTNPNGIKDSFPNNDTLTSVFTVNPVPNPDLGKDASICPGHSITISTSSLSGDSYIWSINDSSISSTDHQLLTNPTKTTTYVVTETVIATGCANSDTVQVSLYPSPVASFSVTNNGECLTGNKFIDKSSISSGSILSWKWDFGDGDTSSLETPSHPYTSSGNDTVSLYVSSKKGCTDSISKVITIFPQPSAKFVVDNNSACLNKNSFLFSDNSTIPSGVISSWHWNFGDNDTSSSQNQSHTYAASGTYFVKLFISSSNGCKDSFVDSVFIDAQPIAQFDIDTSIQCHAGNKFNFTDKSSISSGAISRLWDFGDGKASVSQTPSHSYTSSGNYKVKLVIISNYGCKDSITKSVIVYSEPTASFSVNNPSQCLNRNSFVITDKSTSSDSINKWNWTFGDSNISLSRNPTYSYITAGTYFIKLMTTTNKGCSDTTSEFVTVYPQPKILFSVNNFSECLTGNIFAFTDKSVISSGKVAFQQWRFGDGDSSIVENPSHTYADAGSDTVKLYATSDKGCMDNASKVITLFPQPSAKFSINDTIQCLNKNSFLLLDKSIVFGGPTIWSWNFGDGDTSSIQNPTHSYSTIGNYSIRLKVVSSGGCIDTLSKTINIARSIANFNINNGTQCIDSNNFSFTDGSKSTFGANISSWLWDFGDGDTSTLKNPSHSFLVAGSYLVKLTATNDFSCMDTVIHKLKVTPKPKAAFGINSRIQCLNSNSFDFMDSSSIASGLISTWSWNFGDGNNSYKQNTTHVYTKAGAYIVSLKVSDTGTCADSSTQTVVLNENPNAHWTATVTLGKVSFKPDHLNYKSYDWDFGNGVSSIVEGPVYTYALDGIYGIKLVTANSEGCTNEYDSSINIATTGIKNGVSLIGDINVYPNPFKSLVTIEYTLAKRSDVKISLCDIRGQQIGVVIEKKQQYGSYQINLDATKYHLSPGTYLLKFTLNNQDVSKSIVKQ